jgi:hypothetical protein
LARPAAGGCAPWRGRWGYCGAGTAPRTGRSLLPSAVAAALAALALMLIGTDVPTPDKAKGPGEWGLSTQHLSQVPLLAGFAAVGAAVVVVVVVAVDSAQHPSEPPVDPSSSPASGSCRSRSSGPACR